MAMHSRRMQELHSRHVEKLRQALNLKDATVSSPSQICRSMPDRTLVDEFRSYLKQTESYIESIEHLLQRYSRRRPA